MARYKVIFLICCSILIVSCNQNKFNIIQPKSLGNLVYANNFDLENQIVAGSYVNEKGIHKYSLSFKTKDSTFTAFKQEINPSSSFTLAFWFTPEFYGRNGTIINLSKQLKDYPIESVLSLYMNKNRIAVMQEGKDLRKENYKNQDNFTSYFMSLKELNVSETYFVTYLFKEDKVSILIDGQPYASYNNVPRLTTFNYITLGASWNKKGTKYFFNGAIDDLYIYNKALNKDEINSLMDFTHIFQYAR